MTGVGDAPPAAPMAPAMFPEAGRRLVVYVVYDRRGDVDDFIPVALAGLREHSSHLLVVVNGSLTESGRAQLEPVADEIFVRDNVGYDIWAHKDALELLGDRLPEFDEVVLTNDTWFGPVRPWGPVLDEMGARAVHFWGLTDHAREEPNPFTGKGVLPYHLQSFWIAVRREMFLSESWKSYWRDLPPMPDYFDAVLKHEAMFTEHFTRRGFTVACAFPSESFPTDHPALFNADLLLDAGCPVVKRRPFFHYPPFLDRHAVIGRRLLRDIGDHGYPVEVIYQNLSRNVAPKVLNADAGMLEVLPDVDTSYDPQRPLSIIVTAHAGSARQTAPLLARIAAIPVPFDLYVTTADAGEFAEIEALVDTASLDQVMHREVRLVPAEQGRDMGAFFVGLSDVLRAGDHDIVIKVHARGGRKRNPNATRLFHRYQLGNLLSSAGYIRNVLALFQREPGLGVVFPPPMHIGYGIPGRGWLFYREPGIKLAERLGIRVPFDGVSPLAPLGGMWIARIAALGILVDEPWSADDFAPHPRHGHDLARILERLVPLAAGERGYHTRTVLTGEFAAISHAALEYKVDQLSSTTPGYPVDQIQFLHRAGWAGHGGMVAVTRMYMRMNHPAFMNTLHPVMAPAGRIARGVVHRAKTVLRRLRGMPAPKEEQW